VNPSDGDWITNAGGINHNHKFGAGLVDATAAVALARTWTNLAAQQTSALPASGLPLIIPDNNAAGVSRAFDFSGTYIRVEHVTVTLTVSNVPKGQLEITLTSPGGTVSRLCEVHNDTSNTLDNWTFMTVRNWGESSNGVWTVNVADRVGGTSGAIVAAAVAVHGAQDLRPTIVVTPANLTFSTDLGSASVAKSFAVSGQNLEGPVTLRTTGNYEISSDNSFFSPSLQLSPAAGSATLVSTPVYARIRTGAPAGTARGSVTLTSLNALGRSVALNGVVFGPAGEADTFVRTIIERFLLLRPEDPPNWRGDYGFGDKLDALLPFYLSRLSVGVPPNQAKAETMMRLTGYNESAGLFDPNDPFHEVRAAYTVYASLGLAPDAAAIGNFVRTMRNGRRDALPILAHVPAPHTGVNFNGFPNAPWGATYGMADAMKAFFDSRSFRAAYPSVANLSSRNFYNWMQGTMFPGRGMGRDGSATLLSMLDAMSFDPAVGRSFAQSAAAAFRIVYALILPTESLSGSNGSSVEVPFQRRLARAALEHLLWNNWSYSATSPEIGAPAVTALMRVPAIDRTSGFPELRSETPFSGYQVAASSEVTFFRATGLPSWLVLDEATGFIRLRAGTSAVPAHAQTTTYAFSVTAGHLLAETSAAYQFRVVPPATAEQAALRTWLESSRIAVADLTAGIDHDGDGYCSLSEYCFGSDTRRASGSMVRLVRDRAQIGLSWVGIAGKTYHVQTAGALGGAWVDRPDLPVQPDGSPFVTNGVAYQPMRALVPQSYIGSEFYRVRGDIGSMELP
jgi:subtilisin-like proprotein convertase family protein